MVTRAEARSVPLLAGRGEAWLGSVVTGGAVTARSAGTGNTPRPSLAATTQTSGGQGVHRPHGAGRKGPLRDEGSINGQPGAVVPLQSLLGDVKLERISLETLLCELSLTGTQPVLISSTVVGRDLPGHLGQFSPAPDSAGGEGGQVRASVSVDSVGRVDVTSPLGHIVSPGCSSSQATGIKSGSRAWSSPRIVFVDIVLRPCLGRPVHSPELRRVDGRLLA